MINISLYLSLCLAGSDILEHLNTLNRMVVVVIIYILQLFYLILRERKDFFMAFFLLRTIVSLVANNRFSVENWHASIILNSKKFQFSQKPVDFAGFRISDERIEPSPKYLDSICNFPTPKSATDIRRWFGLINQVSNYAKLRKVIAPFRYILSPKCQFMWTEKLNQAFKESKEIITDAIRSDVQVFDLEKLTCLRPDWSKQGLGYFLMQKHCECNSRLPDCCTTG